MIQCGVRPGRSTTDQIFTLHQIFEKSWEYAKASLHMLCRPLQRFDRFPREKLWGVLWVCWRPPVTGRQVTVLLFRSLCPCRERPKSRPFTEGVGLRQGCVLSPHIFMVWPYIDLIDSQADEGVTVGSCRINRLLSAGDFVLPASSQQGLQHALDRFSAACDRSGMKISTKNIEVICLFTNPRQCMLQVNVETLVRIEKPQLRLLGHVSRIPYESLARQALLAKSTGKRPGGLPRSGWSDYISDLAWSCLGVELAELSEIAVDLGGIPTPPWAAVPASLPRGRVGMKMNEMDNIYVITLFTGV